MFACWHLSLSMPCSVYVYIASEYSNNMCSWTCLLILISSVKASSFLPKENVSFPCNSCHAKSLRRSESSIRFSSCENQSEVVHGNWESEVVQGAKNVCKMLSDQTNIYIYIYSKSLVISPNLLNPSSQSEDFRKRRAASFGTCIPRIYWEETRLVDLLAGDYLETASRDFEKASECFFFGMFLPLDKKPLNPDKAHSDPFLRCSDPATAGCQAATVFPGNGGLSLLTRHLHHSKMETKCIYDLVFFDDDSSSRWGGMAWNHFRVCPFDLLTSTNRRQSKEGTLQLQHSFFFVLWKASSFTVPCWCHKRPSSLPWNLWDVTSLCSSSQALYVSHELFLKDFQPRKLSIWHSRMFKTTFRAFTLRRFTASRCPPSGIGISQRFEAFLVEIDFSQWTKWGFGWSTLYEANHSILACFQIPTLEQDQRLSLIPGKPSCDLRPLARALLQNACESFSSTPRTIWRRCFLSLSHLRQGPLLSKTSDQTIPLAQQNAASRIQASILKSI